MRRYLFAYFREKRVRVFLTVAGLSLALASVFIAYGVAGWVDATSSKALSYAIDRASLWVVPNEGVHLDQRLGAIVSTGQLPAALFDSVRSADNTAVIRRVAVGVVQMNDRPVVLYATDDNSGSSLFVSTEIWSSLGEVSAQVRLGGRSTTVAGPDSRLPPSAVSGSFETWASAIHSSSGVSWLLVSTERPRLVADTLAKTMGARITDSPDELISRPAGREIKVFLLNASLSRFDPFSFRTKFSSLVLSIAMSTIFGWVARFVFFVGLILSITSALIGVREKRREIGLFAALGFQNGVTLLLLFESLAVAGLSFLLGSIVAMVALAGILPEHIWLIVMGPSLVMGFIYAMLLLILTPLVAAQRVAARSAIDLVREGVAT